MFGKEKLGLFAPTQREAMQALDQLVGVSGDFLIELIHRNGQNRPHLPELKTPD